MGQSAMGRTEQEIDAMAQDVPEVVRANRCGLCLWAGCECRKGSMFNELGPKDCDAYTYYD